MAVYYLTGTMLNCGERMMVLLLAEGQEPKLVIGKLFPQNEEALGAQVIYFEDTDDYVGILASEMSEDGVIGVDKVWPARFLLALMDKMPSAKFVEIHHISLIISARLRLLMSRRRCGLHLHAMIRVWVN